MNTSKPQLTRFQALGVVILTLCAIAALFKSLSANKTVDEPILSTGHYDFSLLTDVAASPGKVVSAIKDGKILGTYKCTIQDALVAWLYDNGTSQNGMLRQVAEDRTCPIGPWRNSFDEMNLPVPVFWMQVGRLVRVRIPRGYAVKPKSLEIEVYDDEFVGKPNPKTKKLILTHFAEPQRFVERPPLGSRQPAEVLMKATSYDYSDQESYLGVEMIRPTWQEQQARRESLTYNTVATSYFPEGASLPELSLFGSSIDAVKVKIEQYKSTSSLVTLVYRNAQISTVNGIRVLNLPTTQTIGYLKGVEAVIPKHMGVPRTAKTNFMDKGDLFVQLNRKSSPNLRSTATLVSISPDLDTLGLSELRFRLVSPLVGADFHSPTRHPSNSPSTVPELKLHFKVSTSFKASSFSVVLPVTHRKVTPQNPNRMVGQQPQPVQQHQLLTWVDLSVQTVGIGSMGPS